MTRDEALQKIKKCLALAASPEAHEAAAAMRQAQKLMEQFVLSAEDVSLADVEEKTAKARNATLQNWEATLCTVVAKAFGCQYFTQQHSGWPMLGHSRRERSFVFIGVSPAAEIAAYAYDVLARQCAKGRKAHMAVQPKNCKPATKSARGDAYAMGWVVGVKDKLPAVEANEKNLQLVQRYKEINHTDLGKADPIDRTKGSNVTHRDWHNGREDGARANYSQGLSGRGSQKQIRLEI